MSILNLGMTDLWGLNSASDTGQKLLMVFKGFFSSI